MSATIIEQAELDETETHDLPDDPNFATQDDLTESLEQPDTLQPLEDDIPDKYRNKSMQEVVAMHQEAEKLIGKHSSEVGDLRKVVDQYIVKQLDTPSQTAPEPEPVDFFEDPDKAVSNAIEHHPAVLQANQAAAQYRQQTAMSALQQKHPDMNNVLADPKFAEWIQGSSVRRELFQRADTQYDSAVADELISLYKERAGSAQQAVAAEQQMRKQQVKQANTGGGGQSNSASNKRVYRRADIIKLMKNDPDRYEALSPEIMQAYAEGRVR